MATDEQIALLRLTLADPSAAGDGSDAFYSDDVLAGFLDAADGSEPLARVAALRPMLAEARKAVDFVEGDYSEKASQRAAFLAQALAEARADAVAAESRQVAAAVRVPTRVPVQSEF